MYFYVFQQLTDFGWFHLKEHTMPSLYQKGLTADIKIYIK